MGKQTAVSHMELFVVAMKWLGQSAKDMGVTPYLGVQVRISVDRDKWSYMRAEFERILGTEAVKYHHHFSHLELRVIETLTITQDNASLEMTTSREPTAEEMGAAAEAVQKEQARRSALREAGCEP